MEYENAKSSFFFFSNIRFDKTFEKFSLEQGRWSRVIAGVKAPLVLKKDKKCYSLFLSILLIKTLLNSDMQKTLQKNAEMCVSELN